MTKDGNRKTAVTVIVAVCVIVVSFFLPQLILALEDHRLMNGSQLEPVNDVGLNLVTGLTPLEKLSIANNITASIDIEQGRILDGDSADSTARTFLEEMGEASGLWVPEDIDELSLVDVSPSLNMDDNGNTMIIWTAAYSMGYLRIQVQVDDETGLILNITGAIGQMIADANQQALESYYTSDLIVSLLSDYISYYLYDTYRISNYGVSTYGPFSGSLFLTDGLGEYDLDIYYDGTKFIMN